MEEALKERVDALEAQLERNVGQLGRVVEFLTNLSTTIGQLTNSLMEERTVINQALGGHKEGIEQLVKAQTEIATAVDNLSRQCATMFRLQTERIAALETSTSQPDRLN
jgi:uncharacterized protein YoxC